MRTLMSFGYVGSLSAFQSTGTVNGAASGFFCRARRTVRHAFWLRSMLESPEPTFCFLELMLRGALCAQRQSTRVNLFKRSL